MLGVAAILLYLLSGGLLAWRLFGARARPFPLPKWALLTLALAAVVLHGAYLYQGLFVPGGINLGFSNAISLIAWLMALIVVLASFANPVENLGIIVLPGGAVAVALEHLLPARHTLLAAQAAELKLHILVSVLAFSLLTIAAAHAILLAVQNRHLRNRHPGGFIRALPPLQTMESLLFQMIGLGFVLYSVALATGAMYLEDMFAQHLVHKTVLSIAAWAVFGVLLWGRWRFGWRGRTAIRWTMSGFVVLLLAYLGSKGVSEVLLGR